jgi:MinD-like ATPase involved in chromosome partitioning or flagellar assembly
VALVALVSAKGSPGTTTTALVAAALWPRDAVLVDADPAGGDVALRLPRADGRPVDPDRGLLSLLPLARRDLPPAVLHQHTQRLAGGVPLLAGLSGPEQAAAVTPLWGALGRSFAGLEDADVLVDAGRTAATSAHLPLLQQCDAVVCVLRADVPGYVHARDRLAALAPHLVRPSGRPVRTGVVVVAPERAARDVEGVRTMVERDLPAVEVLGHLAWDPEGAAVFAGAPRSRPERTLLVRSARPVVAELAAWVAPEVEPSAPGGEPAAQVGAA